MKDFLPLDEPLLGETEQTYLTDCIQSGWLSWQGKYVQELENKFAQYCGCQHASSLCNGSTALLVALRALGIGPGDEVIVPTLTFSATAFAVSLAQATVRFVDCAPHSMTLDPVAFEQCIGPRTRAVIPVHLYGYPADMKSICTIAHAHRIKVIEDVAEAVGAEYHGQRVGSFGDVGCFSFHNKLMASGEGGMITTQSTSLAERVNLLKTPAPENRTEFAEISFNYRLSNLHCAVALAQLERLEEVVAKKQRMAQLYSESFANIPGIQILPTRENARTVFWRYSIFVTPEFPLTRDQLVEKLREQGYQARAIFQPLHRHPYYHKYAHETYPVAEDLSARGLDIPSSPKLTEKQILGITNYIAKLGSR